MMIELISHAFHMKRSTSAQDLSEAVERKTKSDILTVANAKGLKRISISGIGLWREPKHESCAKQSPYGNLPSS